MRIATAPIVGVSLAVGLSYPLLWDQLPGLPGMALKGAGVGLLALAAALRARGPDGWLLALVLALGSAGDVLLELNLASGAAAFAVGHVAAILLYRRNRRLEPDRMDIAVALLLLATAAAVPALLLWGRPEAVPFTLYALPLGAMAARAWLSRFPRALTGLGAILFLASDMLIAFRMAGDAAGLAAPIWLLYYVGQLLIFIGATSSLPARPAGRGTMRSMVEG
ncbi:MAG TPA: lysoplasmalogenase family protein [Allosphingosinicella sp.]|jgi:uncharacterized membrane protein YhhN|nr:lysoplasmalogenase family protein [Allosphingosinicella sp.]